MTYYELTPAYGRDYKSAKEVKEAFASDRDFLGDYQLGFRPINRPQLPKPCTVLLRYKCNTMVCNVVVR
jgi:hypothetical protein